MDPMEVLDCHKEPFRFLIAFVHHRSEKNAGKTFGLPFGMDIRSVVWSQFSFEPVVGYLFISTSGAPVSDIGSNRDLQFLVHNVLPTRHHFSNKKDGMS